MRKRSLLLVMGALVLFTSLVVGPTATATTERASAGTVVIVHDQEPGILNNYLSEGNGYTVSLVMNPILAGGLIYNDKVKLVPYLLTSVPKLLKAEPLTATATYKPNAIWSDGKPVTGADFVATYRTIMNPNWDITSREGWEDIAKIKVKGKSFTVTFKPKRAYAAWDLILGASPMPAHKVAGQDFNKLWSDSIDISSGPFKFQSWQKGTQLSIDEERCVQGRRSRPSSTGSSSATSRALRSSRRSRAVRATSSSRSRRSRSSTSTRTASSRCRSDPSYQWEHLDFQQGAKAHPALKKKFVRQAIVTGINRSQIREVLYVKTGLVANLKLIPVLQSNIFKPFEPQYKTPYKRWAFSQKNGDRSAEEERVHRWPGQAELPGTRRSSAAPVSASSRSPSPRRRATRFAP